MGVNCMNKHVYQWLTERNNRRKFLQAFGQPLTSRQISKKTGIPQGTCSYLITRLVDLGVLICLNPTAHTSRLYWLTRDGHGCRKKLDRMVGQSYQEPVWPDMDWHLYGWVCYSHRSAVIKALTVPMQPSEIKRVLRQQQSRLKISANNIRDIISLFRNKGIVQPVKARKKVFLRYELTGLGIKLRRLLIQAEAIL